MQVKNTFQDNMAPLSERFTVVVISHNRSAFLRRTLHYYSSYPCSVLVLDSSVERDEQMALDFPSVDYRHLPQFTYKGLQDKLVYGVNQVKTPYMVFAADDDFLLHDALTESVEFLEANPDYGLCHGYGFMYVACATEVNYFRRDRKVHEDYNSELAEDRVIRFMDHFLPPFYAVTRTDLLQQWYSLLPPGTSFEWQEIGHTFYLLACAKARILPIPFAVRELNYGGSEHNTNVLTVLSYKDAKSVAEREQFAEFLASLPTPLREQAPGRVKQIALDSFAAMSDCLLQGRSLKGTQIINSVWTQAGGEPVRSFGPQQFVEMPFYNQRVFDLLTEFEFLLHAMPAGRLQLQQLEGILVRQHELMRVQPNDNERTLRSRLWEAQGLYAFNRTVVKRLAESLKSSDEPEEAIKLQAWAERLDSVPGQQGRRLLENMHSGRLLSWLEARSPNAQQLTSIAAHLSEHQGGPRFGILLLDLDADMFKLQATFDSLVNGHCKAFNVVVFTTGDLPATTTVRDTVHFVKVSTSNYVERVNQIIGQSTADWMVLAEAGDQFTPSGLLRASLELIDADGVRAVAMDEIQRKADGSLIDVFRPGVNLDFLQSVPSLMARHWLINREVLAQARGFTPEYSQALEQDLLLRLIEDAGLAGLAHLAEPLLICDAPPEEEKPQERQVLTRHLAARGYRAQVTSALPLTYQIDYQHAERPLVSVILESRDNFEQVQQALVSVLQRTRYHRHEILVADNHSQSEELAQWLDSLEGRGERIRILRSDRRLSASALYNWASAQAKGEYLVLLSAEAQVINANWLDSLLNQAQRPEVGIVGSKQMDNRGITTQAGLVLKPDGRVASVFVGERKDAKGYLNGHQAEQNYSAVSGACLMIRKDLFEAVGGLDEDHFAEAFADVDLCLKAADAGYLTVWTPQAQMLHAGTFPDAPEAADALRDKWQARFNHDAARNPSLALTGTGFALGTATAVDWARLLP
ncbi:glycosyltransferase domain-containing protein [Pseudomonas brassicacearum]|uniref:Glycosyltransferase domain-containing protein n=1 Tax=Pseudomonas brassicacearum TaxID=930166 RepID=A0AAW8M4C3_9PSED|nr:TIGR00180 family glycosyltransferase [Pseudomonas brassicacearum]MDR6956243.1 glycosyltransferase domain-containing protein [Pseudomonas brassicacearum]